MLLFQRILNDLESWIEKATQNESNWKRYLIFEAISRRCFIGFTSWMEPGNVTLVDFWGDVNSMVRSTMIGQLE